MTGLTREDIPPAVTTGSAQQSTASATAGGALTVPPPVDVSVLVPARDEAENLALLLERTAEVFARESARCEMVVVDDGSVDATWETLRDLAARYPFLQIARHRSVRGVADALRTAYRHSSGRVLVFYPADLQYHPDDIPRLIAPILAGESDIVTAHKQGAYEKAFVSRVYNSLSRSLFKVSVRDLNSAKAFRREVMESLPDRPDWHRYLVVMAAAQGYSVSEVPVRLYPRHAGRSKFATWHRIPVGVMDMLSVWFELRFGQKPLLLFGMIGVAIFSVGIVASVVALGRLLVVGTGQRWVWTIIQTCLILGGIMFAAGMLGEQIAGQRSEIKDLRRRLDDLRATAEERGAGQDGQDGGAGS